MLLSQLRSHLRSQLLSQLRAHGLIWVRGGLDGRELGRVFFGLLSVSWAPPGPLVDLQRDSWALPEPPSLRWASDRIDGRVGRLGIPTYPELLGASWLPSGGLLGPPRGILGSSWASRGPPGPLLGPSWILPGSILGASSGPLGASWASCGPPGPLLGPCGPPGPLLGPSWEPPGSLLRTCWGPSGASWSLPGASWACRS